MRKNLNFAIENNLSDEQKKFLKEKLKCKMNLNGHIISIRNATVEEEQIFISRLNTICSFEITYNYEVLEIEELEKFEFFYCPGQMENPDTFIKMHKWELEMNACSSFDYSNFCPICKKGLIQKAPLKIKGLSTRHFTKKLVTPFWLEWIINIDFKNALIEDGISGIDFVPLFDSKDEIIQTNLQIKPSKVLTNSLVYEYFNKQKSEVSSKKCDCNNYFYRNKGKTIKLKQSIKSLLADFNELEEHISSRIGIYIISKKMLHTMINSGIRPNIDFEFIPVEFE